MPIGSAAQTSDFLTEAKTKAYFAPTPDITVVPTAGYRAFNYVSEQIDRSQPLADDPEYGNNNDLTDPSDPAEGDISAAGTVTTRLCLRQSGDFLAYTFGAPATTGAGPYVHVFKSGKSQLPVGTLVFETGASQKTVKNTVFAGLKISIGRAAEIQKLEYPVIAANADTTAPVVLTSVAALTRDFVPKGGFEVFLNDVKVARLLTADVNYDNPIEEDRYVNLNLEPDEFSVGMPSCKGTFKVRYTSPALLDSFDGKTPMKLEIIGTAASGNKINILLPRIFATRPNPKRDGKKMEMTVDWTAAANGDNPMLEITLNNTIATY